MMEATKVASRLDPALSEWLGAWSRNKPAAPGHYWVWQPNDAWPCRGRVHLVEVVRNGSLVAWVPYMDYADSLQCDTWTGAMWLGPVAAPEAPNK